MPTERTPAEKVALVTGAAKRLGREIALALARDGWDIVVHYHHSGTEAQQTANDIIALGRRALTVQCDLASEASVRDLLTKASALGQVSCVVNNASLFDFDEAASFTVGRLDQHMHTNLAAPVILAQALHAATQEGQQSVVINLLDQKLYNPNPDFLSYTLSKSALQHATVLLAQALAPKVRVAGVAPGITMVSGDQSNDGFEKAHRMTPLGKSSTPDDIARAVCFIASAPAITGTTLVVDGGQHLMPMARDVMFLT